MSIKACSKIICFHLDFAYVFSISSEMPSQFAGRFSKSANERETMLEDRKNRMLQQAKRYVHI